MANIIYNGGDITDSSRTEGILTFSEVPNILEIKEYVSGDKGQLKIVVNDNFSSVVNGNGQFYITLFEETISNVLAPNEATNKRFYVFPQSAKNTVMSMVKAFRSCASLSSEFIITTATTTNTGDTVLITAKTIGKRNFQGNWDTNIPSQYVSKSIVNDGSADSSLDNLAYNDGYFNSKIDVEVYQGDNYITTLEKNFYGDSCSFNVTPVLATMTEPTNELNGESVLPYTLKIIKLAENGAYTSIGEVSGLTTYGYMANDSEKYKALGLYALTNNFLTDKANILYTYDSYIPYSVLLRAGNNPSAGFTAIYTVYNSAMEVIYTYTDIHRTSWGDPSINEFSFTIPPIYVNSAYVVDLSIPSGTLRFKVIKPLNAADGYQRVYWRNEYGGLSFFDFTGSRSITDNIDVETYEKSIFGFYDLTNDKESCEIKKIYSNRLSKTWKMKSHIMEKGGQYIFNSMMKSKKIWTELDGKDVMLIPKALEVVEDTGYDNLFTVTVQFEFSDYISN